MNFQNVSLVHVYYKRGNLDLYMGKLASRNRKVFFEYHPDFLKTKLELSPFKLPLKLGISSCEDRTFEGLFGVFNDSLPDGWGRLLLDRKLLKSGINPKNLSPLDRLCYVGTHGLGALFYEPEIPKNFLLQKKNLDHVFQEILLFQKNDDAPFVDDLFLMSGSSSGARPKILIHLDDTLTPCHTSGVNEWIIKFPAFSDPKDVGPIEYAYHLMAKAAHLEVPEARLFSSQKTPGYFGVKRFDRTEETCFHMHTISGLLHADHQIPSLDYLTIMKATFSLTKDIQECAKQFRNIAFNIFTHNRDDHAKNFSFLMHEKGTWHVSPAYDLTFSSGPRGEHSTMILGEGKNPTLFHLLKLAELIGLKKHHVLQIIEDVKYAASNWSSFAKEAGVSKRSSILIQSTLERIHKYLMEM